MRGHFNILSARRPCPRRGTVLVMAIILSVVLTGMIMILAWTQGITTQSTSAAIARDQGFFVAESGAQRALWQWKHHSYTWNHAGTWQMTVSNPSTGRPATVWTQNYSCQPSAAGANAYVISCTASCTASGVGSSTVSCAAQCAFTATPPSPGGTVLAGSSAGNISGNVTINGSIIVASLAPSGTVIVNGNLTVGSSLNGPVKVNGDCLINGALQGKVQVTGDMKVNGDLNNASATIGGNLTYNGNKNQMPKVTGTTSKGYTTITVPQATDPGQNVNTMINTLKAQTTANLGATVVAGSLVALNFNNSPSGIIYIPSEVTINGSVVITGTGTLVIGGNWTQNANFPSSGSATLTLVCGGVVQANSGSLNLNGSLYGASNWTEPANFSITGVVLFNGDENISGSGTIGGASPPSFDTRSGGGAGSTSILLSNFSGPVQ